MQQPPNQDGGTASALRSDAQQLGSTAASRLHSEVDARKETAVNQAQSVSAAISQAAEGLDESSPDWLKSAFRQGAQQIQRLADSVEQKDSRQLMRDAQDFARNNPGTFLAACAAIGFAAARVLKAGGEQQSSRPSGETSSFGQASSFDQGQASGRNPAISQNPAFPGQAGTPSAESTPAYGSAGSEAGTRADTPGEFA
ncbi:MAG TPA: hypothetical protein VE891_13900 [Allosphingosinicella sp.]|nr:hypothetical protein [Allosphingosinicella sp.]